MKFSVKVGLVEKHKTDCLIIPVFENRRLSHSGEALDKQNNKALSSLLHQGDCDGKKGQILFIPANSIVSSRLLLIGCGPSKEFNRSVFREAIFKVIATLSQAGAHEMSIALEDFSALNETLTWKIRQTIQICHEVLYKGDELKSKKVPSPRKLAQIQFLIASKKMLTEAENAIEEGTAISEGMDWMKRLANLPPNICTPGYLADEAKRFAKKHTKTSVAILEKKDLEALKMGAFLSVAQSSVRPPKLITLEYRGNKKALKPIVLVGKGITFDTGGNSLKPAINMIGMKFDMSGAASILGVFKAIEALQLPINVIGVIPTCENMPGATASRPDDVVTSMSGQTIEILNTDAEGRLILADALTYCERFNPEAVIDIATLTGACVVALGHHFSGLMGNDETLKKSLLKAGNQANDLAWELPLSDDYAQSLQSETADLANIAAPDAGAGAVIAGCFLGKFTQKYRWAHLDIAGTACYYSGPKRGSSGRPVPLLVQYLIDYSQSL